VKAPIPRKQGLKLSMEDKISTKRDSGESAHSKKTRIETARCFVAAHKKHYVKAPIPRKQGLKH